MIYDTAEVAEKLGVSKRRVRQLAASRKLGKKKGSGWIFTDSDVKKMSVREPGRPRKTPDGRC